MVNNNLNEYYFRTEDFLPEDILEYYVETNSDRIIVDKLKSASPVILRGSRGIGKSFLMRVAEAELNQDFNRNKILPVYITFSKSTLLRTSNHDFVPWMTAKITSSIKRVLTKKGFKISSSSSIQSLSPFTAQSGEIISESSLIENQENFWDENSISDISSYPDIDNLKEFIEDICDEYSINRINLFIDEAAHVFIPDQQRQFFTLMRDLRSPRVSINAAVYPGTTSYGDSFQVEHDATIVDVQRSFTDDSFISSMKEIILKQRSSLEPEIKRQGDLFSIIAHASMGNPRILLKTFSELNNKLNSSSVASQIKEYYRQSILAEHSSLSEKYPGHKKLVDWGRNFIEDEVLPKLYERNANRDSELSSAIWVHRDIPALAKESLKLLCYSGILVEDTSGIRATRSEVGTRFIVNFGCNFSSSPDVINYAKKIRNNFSIKKFIEFGAKHQVFSELENQDLVALGDSSNEALENRLNLSIDSLDLTNFQKEKIRELNISNIRGILRSTEDDFKTLSYVGDIRARQIRNSAITAVTEYLSG